MQKGFWKDVSKPIIGLSPMDGVTDHPYRSIHKKYGKPAVMYTEFTSVEGVCHGADRLLVDFLYDETQRPIVAQVYGTTPQFFRETAVVLCQLGFDGIDINMGCPAKNVAHTGAGAALIKTPKLAQEIIQATKAGVEDWIHGMNASDCEHISESIVQEVEARHNALPKEYQQRKTIPVSVKTRVGYDKPVINDWIPTLLEMEPATIALHGRTLTQHYSGLASWEAISEAAHLIHKTETLILGNGDVQSLEDAYTKISTYKVDGVLLGRATFGNPFIYVKPEINRKNIFEIALEHAYLYESSHIGNERYNFLPMRKHLGWYVKSIPNASQIRIELFRANSADEVKAIFEKFELI